MDVNKSLARIDQAQKQGALIYAQREEIGEITEQYEPLVTIIQFDENAFAAVGMGNFYPMKSAQHQIAQACGISFLPELSKTWTKGSFQDIELRQLDGTWQAFGDYAVMASAVAQRRGPDGTMLKSSGAAYEFNVCDRFNADCMSKNPSRLIDARKKLLETKKFSTRRAATGAELAAVREISGVPTAFKAQDLKKPMCFGQIIESQTYKNKLVGMAMQSPEGREQVLNKALGLTASVYGKQETPKMAEIAFNHDEPDDTIPGMEDPEPQIDNESFSAEQQALKQSLIEWEESGQVVYLNNKKGKVGDPHKEHLARIRNMISQDPVNVEDANTLLDGLSRIYNN